ncbi:YniB family protein [Uliginosibacterium sp. H1]|uniref:YniB family protein n=1 Tax=Uliginosibacterium sp. H1 TaxID=3114757 RepID=UPI002E17A496|nr:YniB family protein [Uliginosibacterium sp. H1]
MRIYEAQRRVWRLRAISSVVLVAFSAVLLISGLKSIAWAVQGDATAFAPVARGVLRIIHVLYEKTQFLSWGWQVAPIANPRELNSSGNYGFLFIICCVALGRLMWDSASHLSARIRKTILRVEELGWEQALLAQQGLAVGQKPDVLQINIDLQQKDQWYKRPMGLVLLGIAIAVLGQWANLQFGLVK